MAKPELLNNITHHKLRVLTGYGARFDDSVASVPVFPNEFAEIQREYPIFLRRDGDAGAFQAVALLGLEQGENLFLEGEGEGEGKDGGTGWDAAYVPASLARGPFMIGYQDQSREGGEERAPVIHVDLDSPRIDRDGERGEAVFLPHGGNSPYLEHINRLLSGIDRGVGMAGPMFRALDEAGLIEPVTLEVELADGGRRELRGNYTVGEEKLARLSGGTLERLHRAGYLWGAFLMLESVANVKRLVERKNARLAAPGNRSAVGA